MSDSRYTHNTPRDRVSSRPSINVSVREDQEAVMNRILEPLLECLTFAALLLDRALRVTYLQELLDIVKMRINPR